VLLLPLLPPSLLLLLSPAAADSSADCSVSGTPALPCLQGKAKQQETNDDSQQQTSTQQGQAHETVSCLLVISSVTHVPRNLQQPAAHLYLSPVSAAHLYLSIF
jgi:hypothetical protein